MPIHLATPSPLQIGVQGQSPCGGGVMKTPRCQNAAVSLRYGTTSWSITRDGTWASSRCWLAAMPSVLVPPRDPFGVDAMMAAPDEASVNKIIGIRGWR